MEENNKELTLKDYLKIINEWLGYILKNKKLVILSVVFGSIVGLTYSTLNKPIYKAKLSFVLESDSGGALTGALALAGQFGLDIGQNGGGAFSGKDPTKVDRSAAYAGRYVAKNIVAAGLADLCEIQISYAIGVSEPTSISINTFGTGKLSDDKIVELVREQFDLRPRGLIEMLDLRKPIYRKTASYGHFGRTESSFTWEKTDRAAALKKAL